MRAAIKILFIAIVAIIIPLHSLAQFSLNMPLERSVFQRVNNKADIQIGGNTDVFLTQIQVKLEVLNGGVPIDWTTINTYVEPGDFRCQITNVVAGWYSMHVRGLSNGDVVGIDEVQKVGVGEVFIIAGQSNAQGGRHPDPEFLTQTYFGSQDDRVNCINYSASDPNSTYPFPQIEKIQEYTNLSPTGKASWCWAILGDKITQNWNVPVLFFNAAITATTMETWSQAANNNAAPYLYLKKTFDYYTKIFGVRAILWHQGESDTAYNFDSDPIGNSNKYKNNFKNLIDKSRDHLGGNLSWVIAKASRLAHFLTSTYLTNSQEEIAKTYSNCFLGPSTDNIQAGEGERDDNVHFKGTGFITLADVWFDSINNPNFINNSTPKAGTNNKKVVNSQFVFGSSLAPRSGVNHTVNSGDWHNTEVWSNGSLPTSLNEIVISEGHNITINNKTIYVKNLVVNGNITLTNGAVINIID